MSDHPSARHEARIDGAGDGFVYGPDLFVSHDRGLTWGGVSTPEPVLQVATVGTSVWALEGTCTSIGGAPPCPLMMQRSYDGGRKWSGAVTIPQTNGSISPEISKVLVRTSASSGLLVVPPATGQSPNVAAVILATSDGGETWVERSQAPCADGEWGTILSEAPDGSLWLACAFEPGAGSQLKSVVRSLDGGRSWLQAPCALPATASTLPGCLEHNGLSSGYLGTFASVSTTRAFLAGGRNFLQVTDDGGSTWSLV
ncbi:MAG: sialidase family protein, partial [Gemmatimonadales bacterium]